MRALSSARSNRLNRFFTLAGAAVKHADLIEQRSFASSITHVAGEVDGFIDET
jgi:hypothetical protein